MCPTTRKREHWKICILKTWRKIMYNIPHRKVKQLAWKLLNVNGNYMDQGYGMLGFGLWGSGSS